MTEEDIKALIGFIDIDSSDKDNYHWVFAPAFPVELFVGTETHESMWEWLTNENVWVTGDHDDLPRSGEQYYDSYWGWWNSEAAKSGYDCPVIVFDGEWLAWDGYHRSTIAALARLKTMPALIGVTMDRVIVSDPKHADSVHQHSFMGEVVSVIPSAEKGVPQFVVRDGNGVVFVVELDELEGVAE